MQDIRVSPELRSVILTPKGFVKQPSVDSLIAQLKSRSQNVRLNAIQALGKCNHAPEDDERVEQALRGVIRGVDGEATAEAMIALKNIFIEQGNFYPKREEVKEKVFRPMNLPEQRIGLLVNSLVDRLF